MMDNNMLDAALQTACPTLMVPKYAELPAMDKPGQRFLSASDGLWIEIRRPWMHMTWPVATHSFPTPYGALEKKIETSFGKIPVDLIGQFLVDAREAFPNEFGAWLIWDDRSKQLRYQAMHSIEAGPAHLAAIRPDLEDHESLAVNLHSHARLKAFFSSEDNRDDRHEVKISGVIGSLDKDQPTAAFRICTGGVFIDLDVQNLLPTLR